MRYLLALLCVLACASLFLLRYVLFHFSSIGPTSSHHRHTCFSFFGPDGLTGDTKNNDSVVCYHFARVKNVNDNEKRCFFLGNAVVDCRVFIVVIFSIVGFVMTRFHCPPLLFAASEWKFEQSRLIFPGNLSRNICPPAQFSYVLPLYSRTFVYYLVVHLPSDLCFYMQLTA